MYVVLISFFLLSQMFNARATYQPPSLQIASLVGSSSSPSSGAALAPSSSKALSTSSMKGVSISSFTSSTSASNSSNNPDAPKSCKLGKSSSK
ncbi:hypothetical protein BDQ12DRAFT_684641 [Crucibulum laeve]|uniref:REJ domain-containing protein n=1 Tax=Crucibulum laeve TaxID=68775 RepID=A0A5C3M0T6_9AGAR|nr:hypothetical protein BDQ12DRAFT_684641 [Crucibulum laeve]